MFKINKEKIKEFFKEHGYEAAVIGVLAICMGVSVGAGIKYDAERTATYKNMCAGMLKSYTENLTKK